MVEDQNKEEEPRLPEGIVIFHAFETGPIDINDLLTEAAMTCISEGYGSGISIREMSEDVDDDHYRNFEVALEGRSSQGMIVTFYENPEENQTHLHVTLPACGSYGDVKLCFEILRTIKKAAPDAFIGAQDRDSDGQLFLDDEVMNGIAGNCFLHLHRLIADSADDRRTSVNGLHREYNLPCPEDFPDKTLDEIAMEAMDRFVALQWDYTDYETSPIGQVGTDSLGNFPSTMLDNQTDYFVPNAEKIVMQNSLEDFKIVDRDVFMDAVAKTKYFERVDHFQFLLFKMEQVEWDTLWVDLDGTVVNKTENPDPKYVLLRWNPAISSFTAEDYQNAIDSMENGFFNLNWSVYDWENIHAGDRFFMMNEGGDHPGFVFYGYIISDPYEDEDWAGTEKRRHYVNIVCCGARPLDGDPIITLEQLEKAVPEINWRRGHSGELLPDDFIERFKTIIEA